MTNIETPEGWERKGPCFTRVYGGKFALLEQDPDDGEWYPTVYVAPGDSIDLTWLALPEAVAWANEQLGVPKPVEVVEREFADGWLLWSDETNRCARVSPWHREVWFVDGVDEDYPTKDEAMSAARAYVRGDA